MSRYHPVPQDAHRGAVTASPTDADEARADRELAEAERAIATGAATEEQRARVLACAEARTHEDRRRCWMAWTGSDR